MTIRVRRATTADIAALVEIRRESSDEQLDHGSSSATFAERMTRFLEGALADDRWRIFVAEVDGQIVSTAYLQLIPKVPRPWPNPPWGYVSSVFTRPAHRDRGIGAMVLHELRATAERDGLERLLLWPSERSVAFYQRLGFRTDETLELELPAGD